MSRKISREIAFKVIFGKLFNDEETNEIIDQAISLNEDEENLIINEADKKFINELVSGVLQEAETLDEKIRKCLKGWTMDRISKVDIAILKLAIYEILYREDIPYKVSINEAVELAKMFSDDASPSFINGVLAKIIKEKDKTQN